MRATQKAVLAAVALGSLSLSCVGRSGADGPERPPSSWADDEARQDPSETRVVGKPWSKASEEEYVKPSDNDLKKRLSPMQYEVTQNEGTEAPFRNEFWDNHEDGVYVDVVSGEPLFSSLDKYESGTGWPSFVRPLEPENVSEQTDYKLGLPRTEVRSTQGDSHLGHLFPDGPAPTGQRYCINSAALRFVPVENLDEEGYGDYLKFFEEAGLPVGKR